jgi:hypothetical protein
MEMEFFKVISINRVSAKAFNVEVKMDGKNTKTLDIPKSVSKLDPAKMIMEVESWYANSEIYE